MVEIIVRIEQMVEAKVHRNIRTVNVSLGALEAPI
jgi:hypothetical protein